MPARVASSGLPQQFVTDLLRAVFEYACPLNNAEPLRHRELYPMDFSFQLNSLVLIELPDTLL
jgi:hypothetical protein